MPKILGIECVEREREQFAMEFSMSQKTLQSAYL